MSESTAVPSMGRREIRQHLERPLIARLATTGKNGPHVVPVWFRYNGAEVLIATNHDSVKARNILRDDRVAVTVDFSEGLKNTGVMLRGIAKLVRGRKALRLNRGIYLKYASARKLETPQLKEYLSGDDVTIKIAPRKIVSWRTKQELCV